MTKVRNCVLKGGSYDISSAHVATAEVSTKEVIIMKQHQNEEKKHVRTKSGQSWNALPWVGSVKVMSSNQQIKFFAFHKRETHFPTQAQDLLYPEQYLIWLYFYVASLSLLFTRWVVCRWHRDIEGIIFLVTIHCEVVVRAQRRHWTKTTPTTMWSANFLSNNYILTLCCFCLWLSDGSKLPFSIVILQNDALVQR